MCAAQVQNYIVDDDEPKTRTEEIIFLQNILDGYKKESRGIHQYQRISDRELWFTNGDAPPQRTLRAFKHYKSKPSILKLLRKFGYGKFAKTSLANFRKSLPGAIFGEFENLTHVAPLGTLFQHCFTDPIFRYLSTDTNIGGTDPFERSSLDEKWDDFKAKFTISDYVQVFKLLKTFFQLLFSNEQPTSKDDSLDESDLLSITVCEVIHINSLTLGPSEGFRYFAQHFNVMYYIAFIARSFQDIEDFIYRFKAEQATT